MATLMLTGVGTLLGGPIGGALGALAGQAIDGTLLRPARRQGPRLGDLSVQTSSYGTPIPHLFGTMRVAGTVIWSTDLIEHRTSGGGGKRSAAGESYSYSASFSVALSGRAIRGVRRIWADGKLLRGVGGDFKSATLFRLYTGGEAQAADPLIASLEGAATPAHRGIAYAVFEEMALADFGNRIPSLTFEVEADDGPVDCGTIVAAVAGGLVAAGDASLPLGGYAAYGDSVRAVAEALAEASGAWLAPVGDGLVWRAGDGAAVVLEDAGAGGPRGNRAMAAADSVARVVSVQYHEPARDYQAGVQRAGRPGVGVRELRMTLPAAIEAGAAKALANAALARADLARERRTLALDWRQLAVTPGDRVRIAGESGLWRVGGWSLEAMVLTLELVRIARARLSVAAVPAAVPGRAVAVIDAAAGTTILHAFEMPRRDDVVGSVPQLSIAAAGTGAGWRRASVQVSSDGGARWTPLSAVRETVMGVVAVPAGAAGSALVDHRHRIEVDLARADMVLGDTDAGALDAGANLAIVGDELVQFGRAERLGPLRWRLSELWRGRRGTEWAAGLGVAGDRFVLLDPATLLTCDLAAGAIGSAVTVMADGVGDVLPVSVTVPVTGASVLPPGPVHARRSADGMTVTWTRRSRAGWRWIDGVDAPLGEEAEAYVVRLPDGSEREVTSPSIGLAPGIVASGMEVRQRGAFGLSRAVRVA